MCGNYCFPARPGSRELTDFELTFFENIQQIIRKVYIALVDLIDQEHARSARPAEQRSAQRTQPNKAADTSRDLSVIIVDGISLRIHRSLAHAIDGIVV